MTAVRWDAGPGQHLALSSDYHEIITERIYVRSPHAYDLVGDAIPSMADVHKEFRAALPGHIEMAGPQSVLVDNAVPVTPLRGP